MTPRRGTLRTWLVATTVIVGAAFGAYFGINPSLGPISLTTPWARHIIVAGANGAGNPDGADGVARADFDGDGRLDVISGHEQGLRVTLSFHPNTGGVETSPWPSTVTLPSVDACSPEDAAAADVDGDGALDIIAGCETGAPLMEIYFAPTPPNTRAELLNAANWTRVEVDDATERVMRILPFDIAGDAALELVTGGKEGTCGVPPAGEAAIGYWSTATPRTGASWVFTEIEPAGWTQQMEIVDLDGDTDLDIVYTDYDPINCPVLDNSRRGLAWLESDGLDPPGFTRHQISTLEANHRWFSVFDWDGDADLDILDCESLTGPPPVTELRWMLNAGAAASFTTLPLPTISNVGSCIDSEIADFDDDGDADIAVSFSHAENRSGMIWLERDGPALTASYTRGEVSGNIDSDSDVKFDNILAVDMDLDGDLDLLTSEQHVPAGTGPGLGVLYFENPLLAGGAAGGDDDGGGGGGGVVCVPLTSGTGTASTTAVTASVDPTDNALIIASFQSSLASGPTVPSSVTGNGLTWVQVNTVAFHTTNGRRVTPFRALGAAPTAGAITATWGASQTSFQWSIVECTGVDTSGTNGSGAVVQSATQTAAAATSLTATLPGIGATSAHLAFTGISINNSTTQDAQFSELTDTQIGTGAAGHEAQWAIGEADVTPTFASANAGTVSIEIAEAP